MVRRQSLKAAGVSAIPVAGMDLFVNGRLLAQTIGHISLAYGLAPQQLASLPAPVRSKVDSMALDVGSYLIGRVLTQGAMVATLRAVGLRVTAQQAAKFAPVVGMAASAALSGWMFKRLCDRHIAQCQQVRAAMPELPPPPDLMTIDMEPASA
jgi:hypothetical protein